MILTTLLSKNNNLENKQWKWILVLHATTIIILITAVHIHMQRHRRTLLFKYERFIINFWVWFFNTRRETILTMLTIPSIRQISRSNLNFSTPWSDPSSEHYCRTPLLNTMVGTHILNFAVGPQLQLPTSMADNSTDSLHCPQSIPNWLFFKIFKFSRPSLPSMTSFTL